MTRMGSTELSRRFLLQRASCAAGAMTVLGAGMRSATAAKMSQEAVSYQASPKGEQKCGICSQFEPPSSCETVEGTINPQGWCKLYLKKA